MKNLGTLIGTTEAIEYKRWKSKSEALKTQEMETSVKENIKDSGNPRYDKKTKRPNLRIIVIQEGEDTQAWVSS